MSRLIVFPQAALFRTENGLRTVSTYFAQIGALRDAFSRVTVCARVVDELGGDSTLPDIDVVELPPYASRTDFALRIPDYRRRILRALEEADLALVVLPGYLGAVASWTCRRARVPLVHFVVGRWGRVVLSRRPGGPGRFRGRLIAPLLDATVAWLTRDSLTFHNSAVPPGAPGCHHARVSSTYSASDLRSIESVSAPGEGPKLLFAGRLAAEKGLRHLFGAVARLRTEGIPATLEVVGDGEQRSAFEREVERLGLGGSVRFTGWLARGDALWERFDRAEIFVLPSLEDMAPRVLLEAMARRVAVVATDVGHVSEVVRDGDTGLLIAPASAGTIANAVQRLWDEPELRERLVARGAALAAKHTLEAETAKTVSIIRRHFALDDTDRP